MSKIKLSVVMLAAGLAAGCAREAAEFPSQEDLYSVEPTQEEGFLLLTPRGEAVTAEISDTGILGPEINLGRYTSPTDHAFRGIVFGRPVNVEVAASRVSGVVGTDPFNLAVTRQGGVLRVTGLARGSLTDFRVGDGRISGSIGSYGYELTRAGQRYEGTRSSGGLPETVRLYLPPELSRFTDAEVGAVLVLLLSDGGPGMP